MYRSNRFIAPKKYFGWQKIFLEVNSTQVSSQSCGVQDPLQRPVVAAQLEVRPQLRDQPPHRGPAQSQLSIRSHD